MTARTDIGRAPIRGPPFFHPAEGTRMTPQQLIPHLPRLRDDLLRVSRRRIGPDHAEDAVQEALINITTCADRIPDDALRPWAFGVLRNVERTLYRRQRRRPECPLVSETTGEPLEIPVPASQETEIDAAHVLRLFAGVPAERRDLVVDIVLLGMRYEEAAEKHGIPLGTVKSQVHRAVDTIRQALAGGRLPRSWQRPKHQKARTPGP